MICNTLTEYDVCHIAGIGNFVQRPDVGSRPWILRRRHRFQFVVYADFAGGIAEKGAPLSCYLPLIPLATQQFNVFAYGVQGESLASHHVRGIVSLSLF